MGSAFPYWRLITVLILGLAVWMRYVGATWVETLLISGIGWLVAVPVAAVRIHETRLDRAKRPSGAYVLLVASWTGIATYWFLSPHIESPDDKLLIRGAILLLWGGLIYGGARWLRRRAEN
jgi:hypothetical protein